MHLDELMYSADRKGPFKLYIYQPNGYHSGGQWFRKVPKYTDPPDCEINYAMAKSRADLAMKSGKEIRICDGLDQLVFHAIDGKVIYPKHGDFWKEIESA